MRQRFDATLGARGRKLHEAWETARAAYAKAFPDLAAELEQIAAGALPKGWDADLPDFPADAKGIATREASGKALNAIAPNLPWLIGGSADLAPSTKTMLEFDDAGAFEASDYGGRNLHFGIREHGMGGGRQRPGAGRPAALRRHLPGVQRLHAPGDPLAALMQVAGRSTSSPTTRSASARTARPTSRSSSWPALRAMPGLTVIRPADANETVEAWRVALAAGRARVALVADPPGAADARPGEVRARRRPGEGRLRARRRRGRRAAR